MPIIKAGKLEIEVDSDVFHSLSQFNWMDNGNGYAFRRTQKDKKKTKIYMHRDIVGAVKGEYVDHINGIKSDNRAENLRVCSNAENARNQRGRPGTSKYKGVYFDKRRGKWMSQIMKDYVSYKLGSFDDEESAAIAYNAAAVKHFGEFALLNVIESEAV